MAAKDCRSRLIEAVALPYLEAGGGDPFGHHIL